MEFAAKEGPAEERRLAELFLLAVSSMQRETDRRYNSFVVVVYSGAGRRCPMMFGLRRQEGCHRRQNVRQSGDEQADQDQRSKHDANARDRNAETFAFGDISNSVILLGEDHVNR